MATHVKEALKHNFQGRVNALKDVNKYIAANPHDRYAQDIKLLLIKFLGRSR